MLGEVIRILTAVDSTSRGRNAESLFPQSEAQTGCCATTQVTSNNTPNTTASLDARSTRIFRGFMPLSSFAVDPKSFRLLPEIM